jgi:hypothetical protein
MIPEQNDRLYVELAEKSDYSVDDIKEEFPEVFEESTADDVADDAEQLSESAEPGIYEMAAARAMHFMFTNYNMDYQEIADELGIDVQVVLDLIGPDSYDDRDIMLEAADEESPYTDLLYLKDLHELASYGTKAWGGTLSVAQLREMVLEDPDVEKADWVENALEEMLNSVEAVLLRDAKVGDPDAFMQITNIMETLHYDNGKPLSCAEYDYFEHYDRDQDFWGFYDDMLVHDFITDGSQLYMRVDMSFDELKKHLTDAYDGASWEHDFGNSSFSENLKESYRRTVSRGKSLTENELFVDFD